MKAGGLGGPGEVKRGQRGPRSHPNHLSECFRDEYAPVGVPQSVNAGPAAGGSRGVCCDYRKPDLNEPKGVKRGPAVKKIP